MVQKNSVNIFIVCLPLTEHDLLNGPLYQYALKPLLCCMVYISIYFPLFHFSWSQMRPDFIIPEFPCYKWNLSWIGSSHSLISVICMSFGFICFVNLPLSFLLLPWILFISFIFITCIVLVRNASRVNKNLFLNIKFHNIVPTASYVKLFIFILL